jgi:hypothetical protein
MAAESIDSAERWAQLAERQADRGEHDKATRALCLFARDLLAHLRSSTPAPSPAEKQSPVLAYDVEVERLHATGTTSGDAGAASRRELWKLGRSSALRDLAAKDAKIIELADEIMTLRLSDVRQEVASLESKLAEAERTVEAWRPVVEAVRAEMADAGNNCIFCNGSTGRHRKLDTSVHAGDLCPMIALETP